MWYEQRRDKSARFEKGECSQAKYSIEKGGLLGVTNAELVDGKINTV